MLNPFVRKTMISAAVVSDAGKVRINNEDNYYLNGKYRDDNTIKSSRDSLSGNCNSSLFAVCDGMGGEEHGEIASLIAVQNLSDMNGDRNRKEITDGLLRINRNIDIKRRELGCHNMGCTIAALHINGSKALAYNVGDSRVYLFREGKLKQLSQDHNETSNLVSGGIVSEEAAKKDPGFHVLIQYLGVPEDEFIIEPHFSDDIKIRDGDKFLICSDGVTDMLSEDMISEIMKQDSTPDVIAENMISASLKQGGRDNITALVISIHR